jgi:hypothetical protein
MNLLKRFFNFNQAISLVAILMMIGVIFKAQSQDRLPVSIDKDRKQIGRIKEWLGPVDIRFILTNRTDSVLQIERIQTDCGCFAVAALQEPFGPGESLEVSISYDPTNRPGAFTRVTQVFLKGSSIPLNLVFEGSVQPPVNDPMRDFPYFSGSLRFRNKFLNLGNFTGNDTIRLQTDFFNEAFETIHLMGFEHNKPYLKFKLSSDTVLAGGMVDLDLEFFGPARKDIGYFTDTVYLLTSDPQMPRKQLVISYSVEDYFPPMTKQELDQAPFLRMDPGTVDMGTTKKGQTASKRITFRNDGRSPLEIRKLVSNCPCIMLRSSKMVLQPGEEASLEIVFDTREASGTEYKAITIFSNDPRLPTRQFLVKLTIQ